MQRFKIILADNHLVFRRGFALLLQAYPEFQIVGETTNNLEVPRLIEQTCPDVLVVDCSLLVADGKIKKTYLKIMPGIKSLVLTGTETGPEFFTLLEWGARGYICRDSNIEALIEAMRAVIAGHVVCSPEMARKITLRPNNNGNNAIFGLSARQQQVLEFVSRGLTNKEIARQLFISETTVKSHVQTILEKIHAKNRGQAVARATREGLIKTDLS